jgi:diadenosine tetraphosphate (Ap4A) HIT family hydrolase
MDDADRRLTSMPLFPYEGELRRKTPLPRLDAEVPRNGEAGSPCHRCADLTRGVIWSNERWLVSAGPPSANVATVFLETRAHVDLDELDDDMAAELGVLTVRLTRAMKTLPDVGRVHVHRWADGAAHFHVWFVARPARQIELYGWGNVLWSQLLPPIAQDDFDAHLAAIARELRRAAST